MYGGFALLDHSLLLMGITAIVNQPILYACPVDPLTL